MSYEVMGTLAEVKAMEDFDVPKILEGRRFRRWYARHKKTINVIAGVTVFCTLKVLKLSPYFLTPHLAIPAAAVGKFFDGYGVILLHMLIIGFLTLVVTTFLKFTGRGDLAPLVMFVGGAIILYECMGLFNAIYKGVQVFFNM
jgi:hypothetical protein